MRSRLISGSSGCLMVMAIVVLSSGRIAAAPVISGLVPSSATAGGPQFTLTVNGSGFGGLLITATVQWNGAARQTTFVSSTQLTAVIPATDIATAGTAQVTVRNQGATVDETSPAVSFTINQAGNPVPSISSLSPPSATAGGPSFTLTVNGANFVSGAVVRYANSSRSTTFVNPSQLNATIQASDISQPGSASITVVNPGPGGGTSNAVTFNVTSTVTITNSSPLPQGTRGSPYSQTLTASGGTLPYTWSVTTGSLPGGVALASSTGIVSGTPSASGSFDFTVRVTDGGQPSQTGTKAFTLVVVDATSGPQLASLSPTSAIAGGPAFTLTVNGANFESNSRVRWNGSNRTTTFVNASRLTADIPAIDIAAPGTASITVMTPGAGASNALTFTVSSAGLTITTSSPLPSGTVGSSYSQTLAASGGTPSYTWSVTSGSLPAGLILNSSSGIIGGTPSAVGDFAFTVRVSDGTSTSSKVFQLSIRQAAGPVFTISGVSNNIEPAQQPTVDISLAAGYPSPISGQLTLKFSSNADVASDDPSIQFATGGRVVNFSIPANGTRAVFSNNANSIGFQTGTVSGTIELSLSAQSGGTTVSPSPPPTRIFTLSRRPPSITRLNIASRSSSGFELAVTGFSTPRSLTQAAFRFTAAQGANLETSTVTLNLATPATSWFQSQTAGTLGGQFRLLIPFSVQGDLGAVQSVSVTLTNGEGTSEASSVQF